MPVLVLSSWCSRHDAFYDIGILRAKMTETIQDWLDKGQEHYEQMLLCEQRIKALLETQSKARTKAYERLVLLGDE